MITETYILPAHWASALVNADESGLNESDVRELATFIMIVKPGSCIDVSQDVWFAHSNDAGTLACDVATFTFRID